MRGEISEAAVERRALIKAIANFIKVILPDTTLAQKVANQRQVGRVRYADCQESDNTATVCRTSLKLFF